MKKHLIDITVGAEARTAIADDLTSLATQFEEFALSLDDDQRKRLQRLGLRNETFSRGVLDLAKQNPTLVPLTIDLAAIERDVTAREQLMPMLFQLRRLTRLVEDTTIALGVDVYNGSRGLYKALKVVAEINGITEIIEELGRRFVRASRATQVPDAGTSAPTSPSITI